MANISLVTFSGVGDVVGGSYPGGWTCADTLRKRPIGPRLSTEPAPGGSLYMPRQNTLIKSPVLTSVGVGLGHAIGFWVNINELTGRDPNSYVGDAQIITAHNNYDERGSILLVDSGFNFKPMITDWVYYGDSRDYVGSSLNNLRNKWVFLVYAFINGGQSQAANAAWYYAFPGDAQLTPWFSHANTFGYVKDTKYFYFGNIRPGGGYPGRWAGRLGSMAIHTISNLNEVTLDLFMSGNNVIAPPTDQIIYHVSSQGTGTGDGLSKAGAWTPAQVRDELANGGVLGSPNPWYIGLNNVDLSTHVAILEYLWDAGLMVHRGTQIQYHSNGDHVVRGCGLGADWSVNGTRWMPASDEGHIEINFSTLATSWTLVDGQTKVWRHATVGGLTHAMVWDNDAWVDKVKSADTNTIVTACAAASAGLFGCDGTYYYLAVPDGSDPNTNGHKYEYINTNYTGWGIGAPNTLISNFTFTKCCRLRLADNNMDEAGYNLAFSLAGLTIFDNIEGYYGAKHIFGHADSLKYPDGTRTICRNLILANGAPYGYFNVAGQQSCGVFYVDRGNSTTTDNQIMFKNVYVMFNDGTIGSAAPRADWRQAGWLSHDEGGSSPNRPVSEIIMINGMIWNYGVNQNTSFCPHSWKRYNWDTGRGSQGISYDPVEGYTTIDLKLGATAPSLLAANLKTYINGKRIGIFSFDANGSLLAQRTGKLGAGSVSGLGL